MVNDARIYNNSTESDRGSDTSHMLFAKAAYANHADYVGTQEELFPQTSGAQLVSRKTIFEPYLDERMWHRAVLKLTLPALNSSTVVTTTPVAPFEYIAWKRNIGYHAIKNLAVHVGSSELIKVPGYWLHLQGYLRDDEKNRPQGEAGDLTLPERIQKASAQYEVEVELRLPWEYHMGLNIYGGAVSRDVRIEIEYRDADDWIEANYAYGPVLSNTSNGFRIIESRMIWQTYFVPAAEAKEKIAPHSMPFKDTAVIERSSFSGVTSHTIDIKDGGVIEAILVGVRLAAKAGASGTDESIYMDRFDGTVTLSFNGQDLFTQHPADQFRRRAWQYHTKGRPEEKDANEWMYIPLGVRPDLLPSSGFVDFNIPGRKELTLTWAASAGSVSGDVTLVLVRRNYLEVQNGDLRRAYN